MIEPTIEPCGRTLSRIECCRPSWAGGLSANVVALILLSALCAASSGQRAPAHPQWPGPGQIFVGTCYQPIDRTPEEIDRDISIMKQAGFNVVRMGDLSWDSFEPSRGKFEFEWFDSILDKMQANGIRVILWTLQARRPFEST